MTTHSPFGADEVASKSFPSTDRPFSFEYPSVRLPPALPLGSEESRAASKELTTADERDGKRRGDHEPLSPKSRTVLSSSPPAESQLPESSDMSPASGPSAIHYSKRSHSQISSTSIAHLLNPPLDEGLNHRHSNSLSNLLQTYSDLPEPSQQTHQPLNAHEHEYNHRKSSASGSTHPSRKGSHSSDAYSIDQSTTSPTKTKDETESTGTSQSNSKAKAKPKRKPSQKRGSKQIVIPYDADEMPPYIARALAAEEAGGTGHGDEGEGRENGSVIAFGGEEVLAEPQSKRRKKSKDDGHDIRKVQEVDAETDIGSPRTSGPHETIKSESSIPQNGTSTSQAIQSNNASPEIEMDDEGEADTIVVRGRGRGRGRGRARGRGRGRGSRGGGTTRIDDADAGGGGTNASPAGQWGSTVGNNSMGAYGVNMTGPSGSNMEMDIDPLQALIDVAASAPPLPVPINFGQSTLSTIKSESNSPYPGDRAEELTAIQYQRRRDTKERARMGTRVAGTGSGGIGGGGYRFKMITGVDGGLVDAINSEDVKMEDDGMSGLGEGAESTFEGEECFLWTDLPMCKQAFRYVPCSPSPNESPSHLTHPFYRTLRQPSGPTPPLPIGSNSSIVVNTLENAQPPPVHLDWLDRSAYLKMSASAMTVTADKGFRSVRGNVSVRKGAWYFEVIIERGGGEGCVPGGQIVDSRGPRIQIAGVGAGQVGYGHTHTNGGQHAGSLMSDGAHVRLGWARREASLNGPCGLDGYSYGVRDSTGDKVTLSRPKSYGTAFGSGDVVGCLIYIPEVSEEEDTARKERAALDEWDPSNIIRKRIAIRYKDQLYFEMMDYATTKEMDGMIARDGKTAPIASAMLELLTRRDSEGGHLPDGVMSPAKKAIGSPARKAKAPGATTKNTVDGKAGKAVKRGRKKQQEEDVPPPLEVRAKPVLRGSQISFFLNGQPMNAEEPAFTDIFDFLPLRQTAVEIAARVSSKRLNFADAVQKERENPFDDGTLGYYPFISCFGGARARFNPGPTWVAPVDPTAWKIAQGGGSAAPVVPEPISSRWDEFVAEETLLDERDEAVLTLQLQKDKRENAERRATLDEKITPSGGQKPMRGKGSRGRGRGTRAVASRDTPGSSPGPGTPSSFPSQMPSRATSPGSYIGGSGPLADGAMEQAVHEDVPERFGLDEDAEGETDDDQDMDA